MYHATFTIGFILVLISGAATLVSTDDTRHWLAVAMFAVNLAFVLVVVLSYLTRQRLHKWVPFILGSSLLVTLVANCSLLALALQVMNTLYPNGD